MGTLARSELKNVTIRSTAQLFYPIHFLRSRNVIKAVKKKSNSPYFDTDYTATQTGISKYIFYQLSHGALEIFVILTDVCNVTILKTQISLFSVDKTLFKINKKEPRT